MNINKRIFFSALTVVVIILQGCNKEGAGCFDKAGEIKTATIEVTAFTSIDVNSNIDVQLLTSGGDRIEVTTGKNLIAGISLRVEEGVLLINNVNSCFWSNGYTRPLVTIRNPNLTKLIQHGYGNIFTTDTLVVDNLTVQVEDASGGFDLTLRTNSVKVVSNSLGPITLRGTTQSLNAGHHLSDGILYAKELLVQDCKIIHNGSNRMELNVINTLSGAINSIGNVYLYGQKPALIDVELTNEGLIFEKY